MRKFKPAVILGLIVFAIGASDASAASTAGQTFDPSATTSPARLLFQSAVTGGNPSGAISSAGVITSFSHQAEATADSTLALVVLRPSGADYNVVAVTDPKTLTSGIVNTFSARIPVNAGDVIGALGVKPPSGPHPLGILNTSAPTGNVVTWADVEVTVGSTIVVGPPNSGTMDGMLVDLSATVEADADGDGFGDETQDLCPTQAANQGACDLTGPVLTVKASKTQKTKSRLKLTASSDEAGTCKVSTSLTSTTKKNGKSVKKTIKLKSSSVTLVAGTKRSITLKLSSKAKSALKSAGSLKATVALNCADAFGNKSTKTVKITVKSS